MASSLRNRIFHWASIACVSIIGGLTQPVAQAQTYTTIFNFDTPVGTLPAAGVTMDQHGNLYGTASQGGVLNQACPNGCGLVYKLTRQGSNWIYSPLYKFNGTDGFLPQSRVIFGPDGNLYGTTTYGGTGNNGEVYQLRPPAHACAGVQCPWTLNVLRAFNRSGDGTNPWFGDLVFDAAGNVYGTTKNGGAGFGNVFELSPINGQWVETILYNFRAGSDGANPESGVVLDSAGNLYGTTYLGGPANHGTVYKLTNTGSGWTESILHTFLALDGSYPIGGVILDSSGNVYGTAQNGGMFGGGTVFELTPEDGGWTFNLLYSFNNEGEGSQAAMIMDAAGNLYATLFRPNLEVVRLTPSLGQWTITGFVGGAGNTPYGSVILDGSGNLYSTSSMGGSHSHGTVFEVTP